MKIRYGAIAGATLLTLTLGLPALGSVIPDIYRVNWGVAGNAYAMPEGACGRVETDFLQGDPPVVVGTRHLTFCFGNELNVTSQGSSGEISRVGFWVRDVTCAAEGCFEKQGEAHPGLVTYSIDPLLQTASVQVTGSGFQDAWCGAVSLALDAGDAEPSLGGGAHAFGVGVGRGDVAVRLDSAATSVGRDATVSGTLCGVAVDAAGEVAGGHTHGWIFRGVGSRGASIDISYTAS